MVQKTGALSKSSRNRPGPSRKCGKHTVATMKWGNGGVTAMTQRIKSMTLKEWDDSKDLPRFDGWLPHYLTRELVVVVGPPILVVRPLKPYCPSPSRDSCRTIQS
jgi:hypothetical protein